MLSRAALYLDFDNVLIGLHDQDPQAALDAMRDPAAWLAALQERPEVGGPRRFLVQRCYLNPGGFLADPSRPGERLYFSAFRPFLTRAGFEVIDCPSLTNRFKNAADIRIVIDALDALDSPVGYDEFVIASSDADFTPLLYRLRALGRRITVVTAGAPASSYASVADRVLDAEAFFDLLEEGDEEQPATAAPEPAPDDTTTSPAGPSGAGLEAFRALVEAEYAAADAPLYLSSLANRVRERLGPDPGAATWFGRRTFTEAVLALDLPGARLSKLHLWDERRHPAPESAARTLTAPAPLTRLPEEVSRFAAVADLPRLERDEWRPLFETLAEYAATHQFNLTESSRWTRDRLAEIGHTVARSAVAFVVQGTMYGGAPLHRVPPPSADEIATAFLRTVGHRARNAGMTPTAADLQALSDWLGVPAAPAPATSPQPAPVPSPATAPVPTPPPARMPDAVPAATPVPAPAATPEDTERATIG